MAKLYVPEDFGKELSKCRDKLRDGPGRVNFESRWQDVSDYILPGRSDVTRKTSPGQSRTDRIFDSTPEDSVHVAAAAAHGAMTPDTFKWFSMRNDEYRDIEGADDWWYDVSMRMFNAINDSNFHSEGQEVWIDLFAYCTGCIHVEEDSENIAPSGRFGGLRFAAFQPGTFAVAEDSRGLVNTIFRDFAMTLVAAKHRFKQLSEKSEKKLATRKANYDDLDVCHVVMPTADAYDVKASKKYLSIYFEREHKHILSVRPIDDFPYAVPRWTKASGEVYGRGPGLSSLPNIRTLNRIVELTLRNAAKVIDPPLEVLHRSVIGDLSLAPASWNSVRQPGTIKPIPVGGDFNVSNLEIESFRDSIRRAFLVDQIQFPPMQGTPASATEVVTRMELMRRILGPVYGRVLNEWHARMLTSVFRLMAIRRALPMPPVELLQASGGLAKMSFTYENALTRAQGLVDVEAVQRALTTIVPLQQTFPEIADYLDPQKTGKFLLEANRVPAILIRSDSEAAQVAQSRAQATEQEVAQAGTSQALKDVTPLIKEFRE